MPTVPLSTIVSTHASVPMPTVPLSTIVSTHASAPMPTVPLSIPWTSELTQTPHPCIQLTKEPMLIVHPSTLLTKGRWLKLPESKTSYKLMLSFRMSYWPLRTLAKMEADTFLGMRVRNGFAHGTGQKWVGVLNGAFSRGHSRFGRTVSGFLCTRPNELSSP